MRALVSGASVALALAAGAGAVGPEFPPAVVPKSYVAFKLQPGENVTIDGRLDEPAWLAVGSTEDFEDISGPSFPVPRFRTNAKLRWDDAFLYVGGWVQETQVWANVTQHDAVVYMDNDFELFVDPDGSTHWYKELEMNAINTAWALILSAPYIDGGNPNWATWDLYGMKSAVYVDGPVNDPSGGPDKFWSIEMALPLARYVDNCTVARAPPHDGDVWRINFSRVEWRVQVVGNQFVKIPNQNEDNWVWSPQYAINMHLPERWGYLQFATGKPNSTHFRGDPLWGLRTVLAQTYYAQHKFSAVNGYYTDDLTQLDLPSYVLDGSLKTALPVLQLDGSVYGFNATVRSTDPTVNVTGFIRTDRLMTFDPPGASVCGLQGC